MNELDTEAFWDDFAETYAEIEQESRVMIAEDIVTYLKQNQIFPTNKLVDLASGAGRYIPSFLPFVQEYIAIDFSDEMLRQARKRYSDPKLYFVKLSQAEFIRQRIDSDVLFIAMNPALTTKEALLSLIDSSKTTLILRIIQEDEDLFQLYEKPEQIPPYMTWYKDWLSKENFSVSTQKFSYHIEESISKEFFKSYFEAEYNSSSLNHMVKRHFAESSTIVSTTVITYELLLITKK